MAGIVTSPSERAQLLLEIEKLLRSQVRGALGIAPQLSRYTIVSAAALVLDFAVYLLIAAGGTKLAVAGVIGYACGLAIHYLLSVRFVFDVRSGRKSQSRLLAEFVLSGLAGMAITALVLASVADFGGMPLLPAKVLAAGASFLVVYALRRSVVFSDTERASDPA
jgi:putative flippase GtrA